jgi:hypothetical protein
MFCSISLQPFGEARPAAADDGTAAKLREQDIFLNVTATLTET